MRKRGRLSKKVNDLEPLIPQGEDNAVFSSRILTEYEELHGEWKWRGKGNAARVNSEQGRIRSLSAFLRSMDGVESRMESLSNARKMFFREAPGETLA